MFSNLVKQNSKRNRKENGLFFISLIVSIVAFYIILSLGKQDVIIFLKTMESDAINKLFLLIPVLYGFSLFILFFLVYFAGKYQLERRSHELGMYLMLGMKRSKLFFMLFLEEFWNSIISLAIGLPVAILLSEMISLITAKIVGLGIIGHEFSFSISAVLGTIIGYFLIRLSALLILSGKFSRKEIIELLSESQEEKNRKNNKIFTAIKLVAGVVLLGIAYNKAIYGGAWERISSMAFAMIMGVCGTFLLFHGIGILFEMILVKRKNKNGLGMFTFRQLQESVFLKPNALAISSLLVLMALCCFGYGISVGFLFNSTDAHVIDYTFKEPVEVVKSELQKIKAERYIDKIFEMKVGMYFPEKSEYNFSIETLIAMIKAEEESESKNVLINNFETLESPYLISLSGYNELLKSGGKEPIKLSNNQMAFYMNSDFQYGDSKEILERLLKEKPYIEMGKESYELVDKLYDDKIVTDRFITISKGFIVTDEVYNVLVNEGDSYWNATLNKNFIKEKGLMQAIVEVNKLLDTSKLSYESYLQNMGRGLFYTVSASYTTIYIAIIFLIIANTVIGVQFLMQQQKTKKRYSTLISLGTEGEMLCKSARAQINWYFSLPVIIATISSFFGVRALFAGLMTRTMSGKVNSLMIIAAAIIMVLCMVEFCYMIIVKRSSDKSIVELIEEN